MKERGHFSRLGWAYVVFLITAGVGQIITIGVLEFVLSNSMDSNKIMLVAQISMYVFGLPLFLLCIRPLAVWKPREVGRIDAASFLLWVVFSIGVTYLGNFLGQIVMEMSEAFLGGARENPVDTMVMETKPVLMFISVVIIAPVMEEWIFRKLLIDRTIQYGQRVAVVVSGAAFGLFHGNFYQFFYACALGMIFAYIYSSTGNIWYCILMHMIINFQGGMIPLLLSQDLLKDNGWVIIGRMALPVFMIAMIFSAIIMFFVCRKKLPFFAGWMPATEDEVWRSILAAPGVLVFVLYSAFTFGMFL